MTDRITIRAGRTADASDMVCLIDCAGYGAPYWVWSGMREGEASVLEVGRRRAMREEGSFSYRNARIAECGGTTAGMLIGFRLDDPYDAGDLTSVQDAFRPLVELEALVPGSWYVNVLAVHAEHRGKGIGQYMLSHAETLARRAAAQAMSVIVEDRNAGAVRLYERLGYREHARRGRVTFPGDHTQSKEWLLLTKQLEP